MADQRTKEAPVADIMTGASLETSASCQLACPHCFLRSYRERPRAALMSLAVARAVAPHLAGLEGVDLTGWGEPLLNPELPRIVAAVRERFSGRLSMTTNGLLLDPRWIGTLIELGLDVICVSVDAAGPETYARARPGGDFGRLLLALEGLVRQRDKLAPPRPLAFGTFLLRRSALAEVPAFIRLLAERGLDGAILQQLTGVFSEAGLAEATHSGYYGAGFDEAELGQALEAARAAAPPGFIIVGPERMRSVRVGDCGGFDLCRPFITASGQVSACCAMAYPCALTRRDRRVEKTRETVFGDVRKTPLSEIFRSERYAGARAEIRSGQIPSACGDCIALYVERGEAWTAPGRVGKIEGRERP